MSGDPERVCPACHGAWTGRDTCPQDGARLIVLAPDPLIGTVLDQRFAVVSPLGAGGMGLVYRARQLSVDREVALKVVAPERVRDPETVRRFLREARLASRIQHPNTVTVFDSGQDPGGRLYIAMELVTGRTLAEVLRSEGPLEAERAIRIGLQVCDALDAAQRQSVIHRDLKPANIIVCDEPAGRDHIKVLDFGLARSLDGDSDNSTITQQGVVCGTPAYMSPEAACADPTDVRSDLYALGVMLYEMVEGRLPFAGGSNAQMLASHVTEAPPTPTRAPAALSRVILRLLEKLPADRYASPSVVRAALEAAGAALQRGEEASGRHSPDPATTADALVAARAAPPRPEFTDATALTASPDVLADGTHTALSAVPAPERARGRRWTGLVIGLALLVTVTVAVAARWAGATVDEPPAPTPAAPSLPVPVSAPAVSVAPPKAAPAAPPLPRQPPAEPVAAPRRAHAPHAERVRIWLDSPPANVDAGGQQVTAPGPLTLPYGVEPVAIRFRFGTRVVTQAVVPDRDQTITARPPRRDAAPDFITSP